MQIDIMKKLLPRGIALGLEAKTFHTLLHCLSLEFDRVFSFASKVFGEIPGVVKPNSDGLPLKERLDQWVQLLGIKASGDKEKNRAVSAKLVSVGGQSPEYLKSVLDKYSSQPEKIKIISDRGNHFMRIEGVEIEITRLRAGDRSGRKVVKWKRNEELIKGFEVIKHAEVEARYYP